MESDKKDHHRKEKASGSSNKVTGSLMKLFQRQHKINEEFYKPHIPDKSDINIKDGKQSGENELANKKSDKLSLKRKREDNQSDNEITITEEHVSGEVASTAGGKGMTMLRNLILSWMWKHFIIEEINLICCI